MSIPPNIKREHILQAIEEYNIPPNRGFRKYAVLYRDKHYACKYLISLGNKFANGEMLNPNPNNFQSLMAIKYLEGLGFKVVTVNQIKH